MVIVAFINIVSLYFCIFFHGCTVILLHESQARTRTNTTLITRFTQSGDFRQHAEAYMTNTYT